MPSKNRFRFRLHELRKNWLEASLELNSTVYELSVSSAFSEPLKDLFSGLVDVQAAEENPAGERYHLEFEWGGDGWLYPWRLDVLGNGEVAVNVSFVGKRTTDGRQFPVWTLDFTTDWRCFAGQVFAESRKMIRRYGFLGYQSRWSKDFPAGRFMRLGNLLHQQPTEAEDFRQETLYLRRPALTA